MGDNIDLFFCKQSQDGKKSDYAIETVLVKDAVRIDYAGLFRLEADHAIYRKQDTTSSHKEFQGIITAYPKDEKSQCQLLHGEDVIFADMIDLNMMQSTLSLLRPKGKLSSTLLTVQKEPMHFTADHLLWDHAHHVLSLCGHIHIEESTLGTLTAADELQLVHAKVNGKPLLKAIHATGPTTLIYCDPSFSKPHKLISYGKMDLDRDQLLAILESPQKEGRVALDKQIYYEEEEVGVFANSAILEYSEIQNLLRPVSLNLKGNIRLFSHDATKPPRCGLADRLNYSLTTRTLILCANPGNKVLFWDESQGVRMSASEVHITEDPDTKHHMIKGIGKVQFFLTTEEQQHLKQFFPYYKIAYE